MEIRIGVQNTPREVTIEVSESPEALAASVNNALAKGEVLTLKDDKGRTVMVPAASIAYIDIAASDNRRVGFGA